MKRSICSLAMSFLCCLLFLVSGCGGGGGGGNSNLAVKSKDFTAFPQGSISITVVFTKPVDPSTVIPGNSLILAGALDKNATGKLVWPKDDTLTFTSDKPWGGITSGGTDAGITLTLKSTIKAKDGSSMQQCKTGAGSEPLGDCALSFVIPG